MSKWEEAWLDGKPMPAHALSRLFLIRAQTIAEEWLIDAPIRCMLEEWVDRERAEEAVTEVLWSGCRIRGVLSKRVPPIPVLVRLMHTEPPPNNIVELEERMLEFRAVAIREWIQSYRMHGSNLEAAP